MKREAFLEAIYMQKAIDEVNEDIGSLINMIDEYDTNVVEITSRFDSVDISLDVLKFALQTKKEQLAKLEKVLNELGVED